MRRAAALAAFGVLLLAMTGCGDSSADPGVLSLVVTDEGVTGLPGTTAAGIYEVTVVNDGAAEVDLAFIESGGVPEEQFVSDLAAVIQGGPFPDYLDAVAGIGLVEPAATTTTTMTLTPAVYLLVDTFGDDPNVWGQLEVTGDAPDAGDLPDQATIRGFDYGFEVSGVKPGESSVTFINDGPREVHHAVVLSFPVGTDEDAARSGLATLLTLEDGAAPPEGTVLPEEGPDVGSSVYSAGNGGTFTASFESGRTYAVLCFVSDRTGGPPHAIAHTMMEVFTVG